MPHIILVVAAKEQSLGSFPVHDEESRARLEKQIEQWQAEYGEIERIIMNMGTVRIMEPGDPIPLPLRPGKGLMIPGGGAAY